MNLNEALTYVAILHPEVKFYGLADGRVTFELRSKLGVVTDGTVIAYLLRMDQKADRTIYYCQGMKFIGDHQNLAEEKVEELRKFVLDTNKHFKNFRTFNPDGGDLGESNIFFQI